jgi:hypothetical protein
MAGLRQGLATASPEGPKRRGGRCRSKFLGSARNGRSPGEETSICTVEARGERRSRPLPSKAINEDVGERGCGQFAIRRFGKNGSVRSMSGYTLMPKRRRWAFRTMVNLCRYKRKQKCSVGRCDLRRRGLALLVKVHRGFRGMVGQKDALNTHIRFAVRK